MIILPILPKRVYECAKRTGAAARESIWRDRPVGLASPALRACSSASPYRTRCYHSNRNRLTNHSNSVCLQGSRSTGPRQSVSVRSLAFAAACPLYSCRTSVKDSLSHAEFSQLIVGPCDIQGAQFNFPLSGTSGRLQFTHEPALDWQDGVPPDASAASAGSAPGVPCVTTLTTSLRHVEVPWLSETVACLAGNLQCEVTRVSGVQFARICCVSCPLALIYCSACVQL
jgi:hypothetical protein